MVNIIMVNFWLVYIINIINNVNIYQRVYYVIIYIYICVMVDSG